jgi:hypothetical protein
MCRLHSLRVATCQSLKKPSYPRLLHRHDSCNHLVFHTYLSLSSLSFLFHQFCHLRRFFYSISPTLLGFLAFQTLNVLVEPDPFCQTQSQHCRKFCRSSTKVFHNAHTEFDISVAKPSLASSALRSGRSAKSDEAFVLQKLSWHPLITSSKLVDCLCAWEPLDPRNLASHKCSHMECFTQCFSTSRETHIALLAGMTFMTKNHLGRASKDLGAFCMSWGESLLMMQVRDLSI